MPDSSDDTETYEVELDDVPGSLVCRFNFLEKNTHTKKNTTTTTTDSSEPLHTLTPFEMHAW